MSAAMPVKHRFLTALERHPGWWAGGIILISLVVRLGFVLTSQIDLSQDEAQYWDWSRRLQLSYYSKGPLIAWVITFWTGIFGDNEVGVRLGAVVNATLAQGMLYWLLAGLMRRPRLGVLTLFVANTMPLFLAAGVLMTTDNALLLCWLGAMMSLYAATGDRARPRQVVLLGLCMALGILAKYMMLAFFGVAVVYMLLLRRQGLLPRGRAGALLGAMALGALLGFGPIVLWNMQHDWVGFLHVSSLAGVSGSGATRLIRLDTVPEFLGGQLGVAGPWWLVLLLAAGWRAAVTAWRGEAGYTDPLRELPLDEQPRQAALLVAGFWPLWLAMLLWSFHTRIYANWPGMAYVAGTILAACGLERLLAGAGSARARRWLPLWGGLACLTFVLLFGQALLPLPASINPTARLKGWSDMGRQVATLAQALPQPHQVFYFSDRYDVTAELAFYVPGQPVAYCLYLDRRHNQYDLWPGPDNPASPGGDKTGWDAIFVTTGRTAPEKALLALFDSASVLPYQSWHQGREARFFTIVVLRNFKGPWPSIDNERY